MTPTRTPDFLTKNFWVKTQNVHFCYRAPGPQKVSEGVSEGFSEGFSEASPPKDPSNPLQNAFKNPSKTFQEGVETDDALGFLGLKISSRVQRSCSRK